MTHARALGILDNVARPVRKGIDSYTRFSFFEPWGISRPWMGHLAQDYRRAKRATP
jgi:hypothetical protein